MADHAEQDPAPVEKKPRKSRALLPTDVMEAVVGLMKDTLSELLAPEAVNKALDKAQKSPQWKALKAKVKAKAPKVKNEAGFTNAVRSGYQAFATLCMHFNTCAMADVGLFWRSMPEDMKKRFHSHMEALKADVAARLEAGEQFTLAEALAALEARNQWRPLPWAALLQLRDGGPGLDGFDLGPEHLLGAAGLDDDESESESEDEDDTSSGGDELSSSGDDLKAVGKQAAAAVKQATPAAKVAAPFKPPAAKPAAAPVQPKVVAPPSPDKRKGAEGGVPAAKKVKKDKAAAAPAPAAEEKKHKKHKKDKERS